MKSLKFLSLLFFVIIVASCDDDNILSQSEIPTKIMTYKTTHFPENGIVRAIKDTERNTTKYELYLSGNFELDFNSACEIIDIDGTSQLPNSVIPQAILDYVSQNYASNVITDWELELNHQQVELNNSVELEFEMNGTFIRIDND
ncbi:MAG: PepSY-like domain-containing protein [Paludibacteraceae bacterium]